MSLRKFETKLLLAIQSKTQNPFWTKISVLLGIFGEHAQGWLAIAIIGLFMNWQNSEPWFVALAAIAFSQLSSMILKRILKRKRPDHPLLKKTGKLFSQLSFPSSHSMSSATAMVVLFPLMPIILGIVLICLGLGMLASRLIVAAHFPVDVIGGAVLGLAIGYVSLSFF